MSARDQSGCTRGQPSLRHATGEVQRLAIGPLVRLQLSAPDAMARGDAHVRFKARKLEVEGEVAKALADLGAFVAYGGTESRISYAGVTASSSQGLLEAVRRWRTTAQYALEGAGR